ncbi:lactate utilization protein C [Polaribacter sp. Hel1_85]|uniref:LutC/YkgG family protein n=1 Tax=Polaribacter sp. Hel1_85 TaxID=1250005 RepID=UPI00052DA957|nr:LUD domain-containing protein [Polaribacter sp. Hel1_85]KGL58910.1 5-formyltetrahydrofolate cyclo-ligase [Polaribacter sp. Hel1_85]
MGREAILKSVKENKPTGIPLPEINLNNFIEDINLLDEFKEKVQLVGGRIKELSPTETLEIEIKNLYPNAKDIVDCSNKNLSLATTFISEDTNPKDLQGIDLAIIKSEFGVAENVFPIRVLPFISNDLVLVLEKEKICQHMHEGFQLISERERTFGLFISGPSKTADIEQCLVIGAQGAMTLSIVLV